MRRPMLLLARGVAILNLHTRFACLETDATLLAAVGTADVDLVHRDIVIDYHSTIGSPALWRQLATLSPLIFVQFR